MAELYFTAGVILNFMCFAVLLRPITFYQKRYKEKTISNIPIRCKIKDGQNSDKEAPTCICANNESGTENKVSC